MTAINRIEFIDFEYEVTNLAAHTEHTHNHVAYKKGAKMKMRKYAVVIELIGSPEGATEEWYVLQDGEFTLKSLGGGEYEFADSRSGLSGICGPNGTVHANPAMSGSN